MAPEVLSAIITAGAGMASAGASAAGTASLNRKTREFNREEARKQREWSEQMAMQQNQWNLDLWNKENAYNTPSAQIERLREAGLNPLFYGLDGNQSAAPSEAAQPLGYERASIGNQVNPVTAGIDSAVKVAQISNIQADTAKKLNENLTETQKREKVLADIDLAKQELRNRIADESLTDAQRKTAEKSLEWMDRLNDAVVAEKESNKRLNDSQRNRLNQLLEGEKLLQAASLEDFEHKWSKISAEIEKMSQETGLLQKDLENYVLNHLQSGATGTGFSFVNWLRLHNERTKEFKPKVVEGPPVPDGYSGVR